MAERSEQVQERVRQELERQPDLGSRRLHEIAQEVDPSMAELSLPQFHGSYVLPAKREQAARRKEEEGEPAPTPARRKRPSRARKKAAAAEEAPAPEEAKVPARRARSRKEEPTVDRERVRAVLLRFAQDFADAESRAEIVQVLSKVDRYVEEVLEAAR